jgi:hypothetical protein
MLKGLGGGGDKMHDIFSDRREDQHGHHTCCTGLVAEIAEGEEAFVGGGLQKGGLCETCALLMWLGILEAKYIPPVLFSPGFMT